MLIAITFPLLDARGFIDTPTGRVASPNWPSPRVYQDFLRHYGVVKERTRGGVREWPGEEVYCDARKALRFGPRFQFLPTFGLTCVRQCAFRRFFSDGVTCHFDVGISLRGCKKPLPEPELLRVVVDTCTLPVTLFGQSKTVVPLISADRSIAQQYLIATTTRAVTAPERWWVIAAPPVIVVEYSHGDIASLPSHHTPIKHSLGSGLHLAHCRVEMRGRRVGMWLLGTDKTVSADVLRRLRVLLLRAHADRETVKEALRLVGSKRLTLRPPVESVQHAPTERLQLFLTGALSRLGKERRDGFPQSALLDAAQDFEDTVNEGERESLLQQLRPLRRNLYRTIQEYTSPQTPATAGIHVIGDNAQIHISTEQNESKSMTNQSIHFGDHAVVSGDITQVAAERIQGSFNRIKNSNASDAIKQQLESLSSAVAEMCKSLPATQQEEQARNLETLTTEALSPTPRKAWYELSASGLLDAAKAVGAIAEPVIAAVKGILTLLA